jgi:hypothetical protein
MKRADLDTVTVLRAVADHFPLAYEHLTATFPAKIVLAAFEREVKAGRLDYGVSLARPFLTSAGEELTGTDWRHLGHRSTTGPATAPSPSS